MWDTLLIEKIILNFCCINNFTLLKRMIIFPLSINAKVETDGLSFANAHSRP